MEPGNGTHDHGQGHATPLLGSRRNVARSDGIERLATARRQAHPEVPVSPQNAEPQSMKRPLPRARRLSSSTISCLFLSFESKEKVKDK